MRFQLAIFAIFLTCLAFSSISSGVENDGHEIDHTGVVDEDGAIDATEAEIIDDIQDETEEISEAHDDTSVMGQHLQTQQTDIAAEPNSLSPARRHQLVTIKGDELPMLLGKSVDNYSVMAIKEGSFEPIPFQFDDMNKKGFPYVPGGRVPLKGLENIFEKNDELVFMLQDSGEKASKEQLTNIYGSVVAILVLSDDMLTRYVYILEGNPLRSAKFYASYNQETGLIKTDFYSLQTRRKNILDWSDLIYYSYSKDQSLLDTMKIRIKARLGFLKATIHNRLIPSNVMAVKNGPVRSLVSVDISLSVFGVQLANAGALMSFFADGFSVPVFVQIPPIAGRLSDLTMNVSLDFNGLEGAKVMSALGPKEPVTVGIGQGSDPDMLQVSLKHNWITGTTEAGWDVIAFFTHSENFKPKLGLLFKDASRGDKPDKPERFTGSYPQIGYILKEIPVGEEIQFGIDVNFGDGFWQYGAGKSINEFKKPVTNTVFTLSQVLADN